jgi:YHS domain-containing protein
MFRSKIIIIGIVISFFAGAIHAQSCHSGSKSSANDSVSKTEKNIASKQIQTKCPVMGGQVDQSVFTDWKDERDSTLKRIYFCCGMCVETFKSNPVKYIKKLEKMKQPIEIVSTK